MPYSTADMCNIWPDCAFYDKSMKIGKQLQYTQRKIFRYRDIADLSQGRNGGHFTQWLPMTTVDYVCISEYGVIVNLVCLFLDISVSGILFCYHKYHIPTFEATESRKRNLNHNAQTL